MPRTECEQVLDVVGRQEGRRGSSRIRSLCRRAFCVFELVEGCSTMARQRRARPKSAAPTGAPGSSSRPKRRKRSRGAARWPLPVDAPVGRDGVFADQQVFEHRRSTGSAPRCWCIEGDAELHELAGRQGQFHASGRRPRAVRPGPARGSPARILMRVGFAVSRSGPAGHEPRRAGPPSDTSSQHASATKMLGEVLDSEGGGAEASPVRTGAVPSRVSIEPCSLRT